MTDQLALIDGREVPAVLIVRPHPDDPKKAEAEIHCTGISKCEFAQLLYSSAMMLRNQVLAEEASC